MILAVPLSTIVDIQRETTGVTAIRPLFPGAPKEMIGGMSTALGTHSSAEVRKATKADPARMTVMVDSTRSSQS